MTSTPTAQGCQVDVQNDVIDARFQTHCGVSRLRLLERLLFVYGQPQPDAALQACVHVYRDRIVLHWYAEPGREHEATAALKEGGAQV